MDNVCDYSRKSISDFDGAIRQFGWITYENALSSTEVERINEDLVKTTVKRKAIQVKNGISADMGGTLHHLLERNNFSLDLLGKMYCHDEITRHLCGKYILHGINAIIHEQNERPYLSKVHRDVRSFMVEAKLLMQMIITLDEFDLLNGATYFLSGSHKSAKKPDNSDFFELADRAVAPAGSIILFDSNTWHAAGQNFTSKPRRALTLGFCPPYIKPQFDYCRFLGYEFVKGLSPHLRQLIGYNSRIPATLNEYYQPVHLRMYQPDQG